MAGWGGGETHGDADGVAAAVGGEGLATGDDTSTAGDATLDLVDSGPVTLVTGAATVSSAAESQGGGQPSAYADTYASVTGADFVFVLSVGTPGEGTGDSGAWATATSTTLLFAVDFEGFDLPGGQRTLRIALTGDADDPRLSLHGDVSTAGASSDVVGDEGYALAQTETFTTDDASGVAVDAYGLIA